MRRDFDVFEELRLGDRDHALLHEFEEREKRHDGFGLVLHAAHERGEREFGVFPQPVAEFLDLVLDRDHALQRRFREFRDRGEPVNDHLHHLAKDGRGNAGRWRKRRFERPHGPAFARERHMAALPLLVDESRGVDELLVEAQLGREVRSFLKLLVHEARQKQSRLHVDKSCRNDEKIRQFFGQNLVFLLPNVRHELVRDLGERNLRNIKLLLLDELQQEVQRPLECVDLIRDGHGNRITRFPCRNKPKIKTLTDTPKLETEYLCMTNILPKGRGSIRANFDYSEPGWYHVTICTDLRQHVFGSIRDGRVTLNRLGYIVRQGWIELRDHFSGLGLDAFVVMPNHIHMLIVLTSGTRRRNVPGGAGFPRPAGIGYETWNAGGVPQTVLTHDHVGRFIKQGGETPPLRGSIALGQIVAYYKYQVTKRINVLRETPGEKLFQRNYWEKIINSDEGIWNVREYIQMNPKNWARDSEHISRRR